MVHCHPGGERRDGEEMGILWDAKDVREDETGEG